MIALIIEQEWDVRESLRKKLEARGYEVHLADNAEEALNLGIVIDMDLIITSAVLPEMSGFELIKRITEGRKDLNFTSLVLVDRDEKLSTSLSKHAGVKSVIRKPITEDLIDQSLGEQSLSTN